MSQVRASIFCNPCTDLFIVGAFWVSPSSAPGPLYSPEKKTSHIPHNFFLAMFFLVFISLLSMSATSSLTPMPAATCLSILFFIFIATAGRGIRLLWPSTSWCLGWQKHRKFQFPQGTHLFLPFPCNSWVDFSQASFKTLIHSLPSNLSLLLPMQMTPRTLFLSEQSHLCCLLL